MYKYWGVSMDARITEVKEIYEESGMRIEVVFDKDKPDFISVLKRKFNTLNPVVKR